MNDEKLMLFYYADGLSRSERRRIEAALAADPELRRRYEALRRDLDAIEDAIGDAPGPAPAHLVRRWQDSIDRAARREQPPSRSAPWRLHSASFALGGALAAALAIGIGIGLYVADRDDIMGPVPGPVSAPVAGPPVAVEPAGAVAGPDAFFRGLEVHFQQSRKDLDALPVEDDAARRQLILHIVRQNRLFAREAMDSESPDLARVLRAFEPVLLQLAADDLPPEEARRLQDKLAFELNVMLTKMNRPPSNRSESI